MTRILGLLSLFMVIISLNQGYVTFRKFSLHQKTALHLKDLKTGDFENVKFTLVNAIESNFGLFAVDATIKARDMNEFLKEYKDEMKRRKVVFPGFRTGVLPPYVMGDIRRYLVCYGLETLLGQLGNLNGLKFCGQDKSDVEFGQDEYYKQIFKEDFRGFDYEKQRDAWREGTDFSFACEFYALSDEPLTDEESATVVESSTEESVGITDGSSENASV